MAGLFSLDGCADDPRVRVAQLQAQLSRWGQSAVGAEVISSGLPDLDRLLPEGGIPRGTLVEWLVSGPGMGAGTLALAAAREACRDGPPLVVVDGRGVFHPPAAAALGIDLGRLLIVRCRRWNDEAWACDQALRTRGVGAVLAWPEGADARWLRRWQLAAEQSGAVGLFVRSDRVRHEPCFSSVRWSVQPSAGQGCRRLRIEIVRCRRGTAGTIVEVEFDHGARDLREREVRSAECGVRNRI